MNEEQLALVEEGLNLLIKKYKLNLVEGDQMRLRAAMDAKIALRRVILAVAVKGNIKDITPTNEDKTATGWLVQDLNDNLIRYLP